MPRKRNRPHAGDVIAFVDCPWCGSPARFKCLDTRFAEERWTIQRPHPERVAAYVEELQNKKAENL